MHTPTFSDQDCGSGPALRYDGAGSDEYLSDSSNYTDNESDLGSDGYNNYEYNYESDSKETSSASTGITETSLIQLPNVQKRNVDMTFTLRQETFNDKFSPKDLLNEIQKIALLPPRDMSDIIGSLDYLPIYSFLFPNEK